MLGPGHTAQELHTNSAPPRRPRHRRPIDEVVLGQERLTMARALLSLLRTLQIGYVGAEDTLASDVDLIVVGTAAFIGQMEGRPMTAHKLAIYAGMPRRTLIRKLDRLRELGLVEEDAGPVRFKLERLNSPAAIGNARQLLQVFEITQRNLAKMPKSRVDSLSPDYYPNPIDLPRVAKDTPAES